ncbi:hypothetical protein [Sanguibacter sp. HDW7]|nr:hypothetical protein [Sanguibacter sp. HDW7]
MGDFFPALVGPLVALLGLLALVELAASWLRSAPRAAAGESLD